MVVDSSKYLLEDDTCNQDTLSSRWKQFIPKPKLSSKTSFPKPLPLSTEVESNTTYVDGYINDIMGVALQLPYYINQIYNAVSLIIDALFRPNS